MKINIRCLNQNFQQACISPLTALVEEAGYVTISSNFSAESPNVPFPITGLFALRMHLPEFLDILKRKKGSIYREEKRKGIDDEDVEITTCTTNGMFTVAEDGMFKVDIAATETSLTTNIFLSGSTMVEEDVGVQYFEGTLAFDVLLIKTRSAIEFLVECPGYVSSDFVREHHFYRFNLS